MKQLNYLFTLLVIIFALSIQSCQKEQDLPDSTVSEFQFSIQQSYPVSDFVLTTEVQL